MKVILNKENMVTFFACIVCCGTSHMLLKDQLMDLDEFTCGICEEPIAFRSVNGLWYTPGNRLFE